MFHYESCGLPSVWLRNGYQVRETPHGRSVAIEDTEGLHRAIGLALAVDKPALQAWDVRFLRKELDLSQVRLGLLLGVGESSIRGWESGRQVITPPAERLLRALYIEHVSGGIKVRVLVERLSEAGRELSDAERLVFEKPREHWRVVSAA